MFKLYKFTAQRSLQFLTAFKLETIHMLSTTLARIKTFNETSEKRSREKN